MGALTAVLMLLASSAAAAPGAPKQSAVEQAEAPPPQSVWRLQGQEAEHLQTGLRCPATLHGWPRYGLTTYDGFGLDVSCGYNSAANRAVVTLYLYRRGPLDAAYEQAKREFMQAGVLPNRRLLSEGSASLGGLTWRKAAYAGAGDVRSDIWLADLSGWMFEYRATYPASSESAVTAQLERLTRLTLDTAGANLTLCARSAEPPRAGKTLQETGGSSSMALMSALLGAGAAQASKKAGSAPASPIVFCVEGPVAGAERPVLAWHGVSSDGSDAKVDRVTVMTVGVSPALDVAFDGTGTLITAELKEKEKGRGPELWTASVASVSGASIFGYFDGRPPTLLSGKLLVDILQGQAKPLSGYSTEGKSIHITLPPTR